MLRRLLAASFALAACAHAATVRVPGDQPTIQAGIDAAAEGDTVLVAPGTYTGVGNKDLDFGEINLVVVSEEGAESTVIDCEGYGRGFFFHAGQHASVSLVSGFTITGGYVINPDPDTASGGGINCIGGSATITNCTITGNRAEYGGGGMNFVAGGVVANCTITDNDGGYYGGGVYIQQNDPNFTNCTISGNTARQGGGMRCYRHPSPTLTNCTLTDNSASEDGGGLFCYETAAPTLTNCITWGDHPNELTVGTRTPHITYCDVEGGYIGQGNIDADPRFASYRGFDYALRQISPCIDAGDPSMEDGVDWTDPFFPAAYHEANTSACDMGAYGGPGNVGWLP